MRGMLVSEVSFGRRMGVLHQLLVPFVLMKVGPQVYVVMKWWRGVASRRESVAATGEGYRGCSESTRVQGGYGVSWL